MYEQQMCFMLPTMNILLIILYRRYGFKPGGSGGSATTKLGGSGCARLTFKNCWVEGKAKVMLNSDEIGEAPAEQLRTIEFYYEDQDELKFRDVAGNSIFQFINFEECQGMLSSSP